MYIQKVMLIDDDDSIRRIGEISLSRVGHWTVISCPSALSALEQVEATKPDVILLDVMMPQMDGVTVFPALQKKTRGQTPIIFMTAKVMTDEIGRYMELGAAGVITKPFEPTGLPGEIKKIVEVFQRNLEGCACA